MFSLGLFVDRLIYRRKLVNDSNPTQTTGKVDFHRFCIKCNSLYCAKNEMEISNPCVKKYLFKKYSVFFCGENNQSSWLHILPKEIFNRIFNTSLDIEIIDRERTALIRFDYMKDTPAVTLSYTHNFS